MFENGTITDKFIVETKSGRQYMLTILKKDGNKYSKLISKSTYDNKKIGDSFTYFNPNSNSKEYIS